MIKNPLCRATLTLLLMTAVVALGAPAFATDGEGDDQRQVHVEKIVKTCDGEDCGDEKRVHKIIIGDDGEVHEAHGDDVVWVDSDGHTKKIRVHKKIDCEGDDCAERKHRVKKVFIGGDGEMHELGGHRMKWIEGGPGGGFKFKTGFGGGSFLGVQLTELTPDLRSHFGVPEDVGVMVSKVVDDSPAMSAGLAAGDIISGVNGESVSSASGLARRIRKLDDGAVASLEVWRDGSLQTLDAAVEHRESEIAGVHGFPGHVSVDCEDEDDCHVMVMSDSFDGLCEGGDQCEVKVECEGEGDCECTLNGEPTDCDALPGFKARHGE